MPAAQAPPEALRKPWGDIVVAGCLKTARDARSVDKAAGRYTWDIHVQITSRDPEILMSYVWRG